VTRIALIKVGALGDVVRTTVLLPGLQRLYHHLELIWITSRDALPIVQCLPGVALAASIEDSADAYWRFLEYDWVISLDDDGPSCTLASELRARRLSGGYKAGNQLRYTHDVEAWFGMGRLRPQSEGGLAHANVLKRANERTHGEILYECLGLPRPVPRPYVSITPQTRQRAADWLSDKHLSHPLVALNTGAGSRWRYKSWGESQTAELARAISDNLHASVIVTGGAAEAARNHRIEALAARPAVVAAATDLDVIAFAALLEQCDVVVSSDSLALHLCNALGKRMVVFFGPTSAAEIDLYGSGEKIVTPLECRACYLRDCDVRPHCMDSIPIEQMLQAAARALDCIAAKRPNSRPNGFPNVIQ
jgi:heptosyltransferase II